jgi:hypothetical protein
MSGVIAAVGISAGISVGTAYMQSERLKSNAAFQAQLAEVNAQMAEVDAAEAYRQGISTQTRAVGDIEKIKAQQEAAIASSGVNTGGAVADLVSESNLNASLNLMDIEQQAFNRRLGLQREAQGIRTQSSVNQQTAETQAQNAMLSGYAQAAQTGLGAFKGKAKEANIKVGSPSTGAQSYWNPK